MTDATSQARYDIAIVGAGMTGAALAIALADTGLRIALLDGTRFDGAGIPLHTGKPLFDPRVSAIAPSSEQFLVDLGVWPDVLAARCCGYVEMNVWDADGTGSIHFDADSIHATRLGTIVENSIILQALHGRLSGLNNVKLIAPARVEALNFSLQDGSQTISIGTQGGPAIEAVLLIGADGPRSVVRRLAGFDVREWDYGHEAIVTSVRTALPHRATALQRFMETGPLAFLPLPDDPAKPDSGQRYCSIVWSATPTRADALMALADEDFALELGRSIEHRLGRIEWLDKRHRFPLQQRHAVDYVKPGIALIGDAAHTIHPLAGQGVNLGFRDAEALADEIQTALARGRPLHEYAILRRYQRRRVGHNLGMMGLMEGFRFLFSRPEPAIRWLRNAGMSGIDSLGLLKNALIREAGFRGQRTEDRERKTEDRG